MNKIIVIGLLSIIIFFFVGIINLDDEFREDGHFFIKIPPTHELYYGCPPIGLNETQNQVQYDMVAEYNKRLESFNKMGLLGEIVAFGLVELLLVVIFIKPIFSKKLKFILLDIVLLTIAAFVSLFCFGAWCVTSIGVARCLLIALSAHYILLRLLRPIKRYRYDNK